MLTVAREPLAQVRSGHPGPLGSGRALPAEWWSCALHSPRLKDSGCPGTDSGLGHALPPHHLALLLCRYAQDGGDFKRTVMSGGLRSTRHGTPSGRLFLEQLLWARPGFVHWGKSMDKTDEGSCSHRPYCAWEMQSTSNRAESQYITQSLEAGLSGGRSCVALLLVVGREPPGQGPESGGGGWGGH